MSRLWTIMLTVASFLWTLAAMALLVLWVWIVDVLLNGAR